MVNLFANMPIDNFLARLIKSKSVGASTAMPSIGVESGPEMISKSLAPHSTVAGISASDTTIVKDPERKSHRDKHSSKSHPSKKLKEPLSCPSSGKWICFLMTLRSFFLRSDLRPKFLR